MYIQGCLPYNECMRCFRNACLYSTVQSLHSQKAIVLLPVCNELNAYKLFLRAHNSLTVHALQ